MNGEGAWGRNFRDCVTCLSFFCYFFYEKFGVYFLVVISTKDIMLRLSVRGLGVADSENIVATEVGGVEAI